MKRKQSFHSQPLRNYQEFRLNASTPRLNCEIPFRADMLFVLNNSDAVLYLSQGGSAVPDADYYDALIPPKTYAVFVPQSVQQYSVYLDNSTEKDCFIILAFGYADDYRALHEAGLVPPNILMGVL